MTRKGDEMDERFMSDEAVEDAVLRYLEESPEVVSGIAPTRDLWPGIEARIGARVLPLGRESVEVRSIRRRPPWLAMAAAAAFLVASTASVTYVITKHATSSAQVATTASAPAPAPVSASSERAASPAPGSVAPAQPERESNTQVANAVETEHAAQTSGSVREKDEARERTYATQHVAQHVTPRGGASLASYPVTGSDEARVTYDDEINRLHGVLESRRDQLDPSTVATVEQNLHVIDVAIGQAREALAKDPHSRMLNEQLDRTLAKKTQLLRAATLLPAA